MHSGLTLLVAPVVFLAAALFLSAALNHLDGGRKQESRRQLEDAVRRSAVACYAAEGAYPPSLTYLEEHYGLQVNREQYTVMYDVFAENLMPDITVLEN